jgi:hypothetical protein
LAVNFSRRYLFLARNYCFYIISQIEFNYNFIFDDFIKETNAKNELISKVGKIYNQTDFVNYLLVINCLYTVEYNCITIGMDYKQHFQNLYNNYKRINGVYPQRSILNKPIMELKVPDFESENEFWAMLMMNLLTKLIEIERKKTGFHIVTVPSATNSKTRKQTHVYGSRYGVLVD